MRHDISRRDFLKLAGFSLGTLAFRPDERRLLPFLQFPNGEQLGRVSVFPYFYSTEIKSKPNQFGATVRSISEDGVIEVLREVVGSNSFVLGNTVFEGNCRRWFETAEGFVYAPHVQPVRNLPNAPLTTIPDGKPGFWAEVTVPYVDMYIENPPFRSPSFKYIADQGQMPRLYYSQVVWIDQIRTDESGRVLYRFNEDFGHGYGYGDIFWVDGTALRLITPEEVAPISPDIDPALKTIVIDVFYQTLSCYEGNHEVFFCHISSGVGDFATPLGTQAAWRKMYSVHMSANTASDSGYDTAAVAWPTFINGDGVAIHAVFWHNDFGTRRSHGCVNVSPEDAKWIFRWTTPYVSLEQNEIKMEWPNVGTQVIVTEPTI